MREGKAMVLGILAATTAPCGAGAQPAAGRLDPRNDAHIIRQTRGDVVVVHGETKDSRRAAPYVAPYRDWRYAPVRRGDRLRPGFLDVRYVEANPAGLPAALGRQRWIRYGKDLLLVDHRGRVLRIIGGRYAER